MKSSHCFRHLKFVRYCVTLVGLYLLVGAAPTIETFAQALTDQVETKNLEANNEIQEDVFSGPQPGEKIRSFRVLCVAGDEPRELEIATETDGRTTLICFVHKLSNDDRVLYGLGLVDFYVSRYEELNSHIVLLSDDRYKITEMLRAWEKGSLFTKSQLSLSVDGEEGPGQYGLNRSVAMTVVVAKDDQVVSNLVFNAPNNRDLQAIMAAVAKALGNPEPKLEDVQQELRAERQRLAEATIKASPIFKLAPDEQLGRIMYGMVNARGNQSMNANRRREQLLEWAGDSKERMTLLKEYCKAVLDGDFELNRYSREAIQELAGEY